MGRESDEMKLKDIIIMVLAGAVLVLAVGLAYERGHNNGYNEGWNDGRADYNGMGWGIEKVE